MLVKILIWLLTTLLLQTVYAEAQQPRKIPRIGFLATTGRDAPNIEPFRQGLRELGYIEGQNILVEYRYAEGKQERFPTLVAELVRLKVDAIVSGNNSAVLSAKQLTKTIPVVMVLQQDPVVIGLVDSLARPGGNITGVTLLTGDLSGKRLELLKEAVPRTSRVGILWTTATRQRDGFKDYQAAARALKITLQSLEVRGPNPDLEEAFQAAAKGRVDALVTIRTGGFFRYPKRIAELAIKHRLPSMHEGSDFVDGGGLMSYSASYDDAYRRAATCVDKILKGAKPADLPVEQPTKFEFIVNLQTAKKIGLTIPPNVLARADRVIR